MADRTVRLNLEDSSNIPVNPATEDTLSFVKSNTNRPIASTITRNADGYITVMAVTYADGVRTWTFTRDSDNLISSFVMT